MSATEPSAQLSPGPTSSAASRPQRHNEPMITENYGPAGQWGESHGDVGHGRACHAVCFDRRPDTRNGSGLGALSLRATRDDAGLRPVDLRRRWLWRGSVGGDRTLGTDVFTSSRGVRGYPSATLGGG